MSDKIDGAGSHADLHAVVRRQDEQQSQIDALVGQIKDILLEVELLKNGGHASSIKPDPALGPWVGN
jgi:hypothetical protein